MYYFKICNRIKLVYFLKFVVHQINSKIVKCKIMMLRKKMMLLNASNDT
jgi:hypothetical protein